MNSSQYGALPLPGPAVRDRFDAKTKIADPSDEGEPIAMGFTFEAVSARRPVGHGHDPDAPLVAYRFEVYAAKGSERTYVEPARAPHGEASPYGEIFLGPLARRVEKLSNNGKELAATCGR